MVFWIVLGVVVFSIIISTILLSIYSRRPKREVFLNGKLASATRRNLKLFCENNKNYK